MHRASSREIGSYILEVAGVVIGLAVFVVGASDVARIFQARSAIRAAVNEGARCLYPTEAGCGSLSAGPVTAPSRSFDVWTWGTGFAIQQESYAASASWNTEPVYEVKALSGAPVEVALETSQLQYGSRVVLFPTTAHAPYFLQTGSIPGVMGGTPLNPLFIDPSTGREAQPRISLPISEIRGTTTSGREISIGSISFKVDGAWPSRAQDLRALSALSSGIRSSIPCYSGALLKQRAGTVLNWAAGEPSECRYRASDAQASAVMQGGLLRVPLMFRVSGGTSGTSPDGMGKVVMDLSWRSPSEGSFSKELGGRVVAYNGSGNFVPRGLSETDIKDNLIGQYANYRRELDLYRELPLIPVDATVTLHFSIVSSNNRQIGWNGRTLEVYFPQYQFVHEKFDCGYANSPARCESPPVRVKVKYVDLTEGASFKAAQNAPDVCSLTKRGDAEKDVATVLARLQNDARQGKKLTPYSFLMPIKTDSKICRPRTSRHICDDRSAEYFEGCRPELNVQQLTTVCGITPPVDADVRITEVVYPPAQARVVQVRGCSDTALPECAKPMARRVGTTRFLGARDCPLVETITVPQLSVGPVDVNKCVAREEEVRGMLRAMHKIPNDVAISIEKLPAPPLYRAEEPQDSCLSYQPADPVGREMLCGRGLSQAEADRCCALSGGRCRRQEVVQHRNGGAVVVPDSILTNAQHRVVQTVLAGYSAARAPADCVAGEPDCLEVRASLGDGNSKAIVSARMQVPLRILQAVVGSFGTVEHSSTRILERTALD